MGQPRFEVPSGTIDGVNTIYTVSLPYVAGSTAVWLNGVLLRKDLDDGWDESSPSTGEITLNEPPLSTGPCPDVIQVFFVDTSVDTPESVIEQIFGTIDSEPELLGILSQEGDFLKGSVSLEASLSGLLVDDLVPLLGTLEPEAGLSGVITEVC